LLHPCCSPCCRGPQPLLRNCWRYGVHVCVFNCGNWVIYFNNLLYIGACQHIICIWFTNAYLGRTCSALLMVDMYACNLHDVGPLQHVAYNSLCIQQLVTGMLLVACRLQCALNSVSVVWQTAGNINCLLDLHCCISEAMCQGRLRAPTICWRLDRNIAVEMSASCI